MNCIVIDDEKFSRAFVCKLVKNSKKLTFLEEFKDPISALKIINKNKVDVIFLDIHMPNFSGFDLIQSLAYPPKVILITSDKNFAVDAFEYTCIKDYLVKPIKEDRFELAINKLFDTIKEGKIDLEVDENASNFYVNIDRRLVKIQFSDVNFIEAKGDYILIKTITVNHTVHTTLKKIQKLLPKKTFLKIHRSFIINIDKIVDIEDNSVLISKDVIPISRSFRKELLDNINLL